MGQINLSGKVLYMPGPWGSVVPAAGVEVSVFDKDIGNADDQIWSGGTDASGRFTGISADWRDTKTVTASTPLGTVSSEVPDATDAMVLYLKVRQRVGGRLFEFTGPYVPPPPGLPALPVVLTWGPPGRARITVNGTPVPTMEAFAQQIGSLFGAGASMVGAGVQHEICIFGEQVGTLRSALQALRPDLDRLVSDVAVILQREKGARPAAPGTVGMQGQAQMTRVANALNDLKAAKTQALPGSPPNPWEAYRQRLIEFIRSLEAVARGFAVSCDGAASGKHTTPAIMMAVAQVVVAVVAAVVALSIASLGGAAIAPAVVAALVSAVVAVIQNLPALLAACGFGAAAAELSAWYQQNAWFGALMTVVAVFCAIVILIASLPAAGWSWVAENVTGPGGAQGLRFLLSR